MKKFQKNQLLLSVLVFLLLFTHSTPFVYANEHAPDGTDDTEKTYAPYFYVENTTPGIDSFPLKETHVTANVSGTIADVSITQVYSNEGNSPISGRYVFPTSTRACVHGMTMTVGTQMVTARISEKETARETYEAAKSEGKTASLMEQQRPNVFTMDIANIMPGDVVSIQLHYTEMISPVEGIYQFVFPTVTGPRYASSTPSGREASSDAWIESPYLPQNVQAEGIYDILVNLSTGVPIASLSCKTHEILTQWQDNATAHISLTDAADYAGNRDFILEYQLTGRTTCAGLTLLEGSRAGLSENFFLLSVQPPEHVEAKMIPPREYIFILDVSGSMSGYPLETAKKLIRNLVSGLDGKDCFNLILFSDESYLLSQSSLFATTANIKNALAFIDQQEGYGGTELNVALQTALALPEREDTARSVVIITDGYISGETESFDIIAANLNSASFFPFGIGTGVNRYLIEGIAKAGQGEPFIVTDDEDAEETAEKFRTYITSPVLTDIQLEYNDFMVYDVSSHIPSTLYAEKPILLFGKWRGEATGSIQITGKTGEEDFALDIPVTPDLISSDNKALPYLWARNRIQQLTDYGTYESNPDISREVTQLGLTYNMATPYTSFIAVLDTIRNPEGESTDVNQPNPLPLQVSNLSIGGYQNLSEPGILLLTALAAGMSLLHRQRSRSPKRRSRKGLS
ncbi:MAG: VWA domain-containing protein [Lachnospiraceae bacterium]|nr:VWA domain-containing protein [Lachnospiraceae bacterium]